MALNRKMLTTGLATLGILVSTVAAFAAPAVATGNVNVRSGPGTGYAVIDTLRRGERVDVQQCRGSWCYVEKRGADGWVSSNYLSSGTGWSRPPPPPPVWTPPRPQPPHWNPRPQPPYWGNPRPPRPPHWDPRPPRPQPQPLYPDTGNNSSVCFNGPNGYFCVGS